MSPTAIMSREFTAWLAGRKMERSDYGKWKENERKAAERARKLRGRK